MKSSGTGNSPRNDPSSALRRTNGLTNVFAKPSDVKISSPSLVSARPSGSTVPGAYGTSPGASRFVTAWKRTSPFDRRPSPTSSPRV